LVNAVFEGACPNCGGPISSERLKLGLVCNSCLRNERSFSSYAELLEALEGEGKLNLLKKDLEVIKELNRVSQMFKKVLGSEPSGPQRSWFLRLMNGESFALISPPGLGKTTFGIFSCLYFHTLGKKSMLVFPTITLVRQTYKRLKEISESLELKPTVLAKLNGDSRKVLMQIKEGNFDIVILTSKFLINHLDLINESRIDFLFLDDVDAAMKSGKSARAMLLLAGFTDEDIQRAKEVIRQLDKDGSFQRLAEIRAKRRKDRIIVFSSATTGRANPLFSFLMGFRPGSSTIYTRNIIDSYLKIDGEPIRRLIEVIKELGGGALVFVPTDKGTEYVKEIANRLSSEGIRAASVTSKGSKVIGEFERGEVDVLVGSATHYGVLVRGIDIPWRVKYAVFVGIPKFKFRIGEALHPLVMLKLLSWIAVTVKDREIQPIISHLRSKLGHMSQTGLVLLWKEIREGKFRDRVLERAYSLTWRYLQDKDIIRKLSETGDLVIEDGNFLIPDYITYVQASGRTSRLYAGGITTGLSVLLIDNERLFSILSRKLSLILEEVKWVQFDRLDLEKIREKLEEERKKILDIKSGGEAGLPMRIKSVLFVVESPTKAKTISNFFSKPSRREEEGLTIYETAHLDKVFLITYTGGHLYDLTTENRGLYGVEVGKTDSRLMFTPYYNSVKRCVSGHQFAGDSETCPYCGGPKSSDKSQIVRALRRLALQVDTVFIGTDPDTEGEKIAWDLFNMLRPYNSEIFRVEFHEVTRKGIIDAISNPRRIDENMVASQVVRRIEDRWIGFKLSQKLQREFWRDYCKRERCDSLENRNLSAGRVQTPVLGWVVKSYSDYRSSRKKVHLVRIGEIDFLLHHVEGMKAGVRVRLSIDPSSPYEEEVRPPSPYSTSTLLRDTSDYYKLSAQYTMTLLQDLFENGLITYHRTDSIRVSETGIKVAESYLREKFGAEYIEVFRPNRWGEGGAHEAIRPTKPLDAQQLENLVQEGGIVLSKTLSRQHYLVYDLVFRRFISSQMTPAISRKQEIKVRAYFKEQEIKVENAIQVLFLGYSKEGFASFYSPYRRPVKEMKKGEYEGKILRSFFKSDVELYTEGNLISEMKSRGIGRPSTYAKIVSTIIKRGYVIETKRVRKLIPSKLGIEVYSYLNKHYGNLVSEERTRQLQQSMDEIEQGRALYEQVLTSLYDEIQAIG
jgi:reverse gyrase